jgi:hypothetical protein
MQRNPRPQDVSWFLDLNERDGLNLDPPYQRRSVWTRRDREYFLDTIFNDYPSPAIFLHKTISEEGKSVHHVIDGKQRLETILLFAHDKVKIPSNFGDERFNGKKFSQLDASKKQQFWNYSISVEFLPIVDEAVVNSVFERINRNARKLTDQELRHAKFDGWLIEFVESQAADEDWERLGVVTKARSKRMADVQFLSELMLVAVTSEIHGFDQRELDRFYAEFDDPDVMELKLTTDEMEANFNRAKLKMRQMVESEPLVRDFLKSLANIYSLWTYLTVCAADDSDTVGLVRRYLRFMRRVQEFQQNPLRQIGVDPEIQPLEEAANRYAVNLSGASTDETPRRARHEALGAGLALA